MADDEKGFAAMFAEMGPPKKKRRVNVGDKVTADVVVIGKDSVFVDLGGMTEGLIDRGELIDDSGALNVKVGDKVTAHVAAIEGGVITLRKKVGHGGDSAVQFEHAKEARLPVPGLVVSVNKGGVEVDMLGVKVFCPISQLEAGFVEDTGAYVGQKFDFLVTKCEPGGRDGKPNVVVSRRALLEEENKKRAAETLARLVVGATVNGVVKSIKEYGAFVDIGGPQGMLHITELGHHRVKHPSDVLTVGDALDVQVKKIEHKDGRDRISLSLKALKEDPFATAVAQLKVGEIVNGEVVRLEPFGAFIELSGGAQGLCHVSELADRRLNHARDAVSVGHMVDVAVLGIDTEKKRISLSVKGVGKSKEAANARDYKPAGGSLGTFADLLKKR